MARGAQRPSAAERRMREANGRSSGMYPVKGRRK
jgi:hypothetical protein